MNKIIHQIRVIRQFCSFSSINQFIKEQNKKYSSEEVLQSLREMTTTVKWSQQKSLKSIVKHIHRILYYLCNPQAEDQQIQVFIRQNQTALVLSAVEVLKFYNYFLKKIVPTNITYFHFLRQSELYMHYIVVRYVLIIGDSYHLRKASNINLFQKMLKQLKKSIFELLIQWLQNLIDYRSSPIYVGSTTIDYLISNSYILLSGLISPSNQNTFSLYEPNKSKQLYNNFMLISIYILCETTNNRKDKLYLVAVGIASISQILSHNSIELDLFVPSYLYCRMIGFIHCPLVNQILYRVLVSILNENYQREIKLKRRDKKHMNQKSHSQQSQEQECHSQQIFFISPLTQINIWCVLHLLIQKYSTYNPLVLQCFLQKIIQQIPAQSLIRAYIICLIFNLNFHIKNQVLSNYYQSDRFDYMFQGKLLTVQAVAQCFRQFMQGVFLQYVRQAVTEKQLVLHTNNVFMHLTRFNITQITTLKLNHKLNQQIKQEPSIKESPEESIIQSKLIKSSELLRTSSKSVKVSISQNKIEQPQFRGQQNSDVHKMQQSAFYQKKNSSGIYKSPRKYSQLVQEQDKHQQ